MSFINKQPDIRELQLSLALLLYDGFTGSQYLVGNIIVSLANKPGFRPLSPFQKTPQATFLFFGLSPATYTVQIRSTNESSNQTPQYYLPTDVSVIVAEPPIAVPVQKPIWPAFPDINLADGNKPLDDPRQPAAYRAQRRAAKLQPTVSYPFPAGSTLVRGHVFADGKALAGATVQRVGDDLQYTTGEDGQFVLFFTQIKGLGETITLHATHALHPTVEQAVTVSRGMTVPNNFIMTS
jgi:hypothetical protein